MNPRVKSVVPEKNYICPDTVYLDSIKFSQSDENALPLTHGLGVLRIEE